MKGFIDFVISIAIIFATLYFILYTGNGDIYNLF